MPPPHSEAYQWFVAYLQPHEDMLRAWLRAQFPAAGDLDDIIQESYTRVLAARETSGIESPKAYLFAIARNLALMQLRHRQVARTDSLAETNVSNVLDEASDVPGAVARAEELQLLTQAIQSLPTRCRQILTLRKIYGRSQKEVAAQLGISEHTVEAQGTIALRKLAEYFERFESRGNPRHE
jgi:RNA polymerase sigma factor (sigma-70 family)